MTVLSGVSIVTFASIITVSVNACPSVLTETVITFVKIWKEISEALRDKKIVVCMIIYIVAAKTVTSIDLIFPSYINERMNLDMIFLPDEKK